MDLRNLRENPAYYSMEFEESEDEDAVQEQETNGLYVQPTSKNSTKICKRNTQY